MYSMYLQALMSFHHPILGLLSCPVRVNPVFLEMPAYGHLSGLQCYSCMVHFKHNVINRK